MIENYAGLPESDAVAAARFSLTRHRDPFPDIPASLLNSADIYDYVRLTGMLHPFSPDKLKSASYEAAIRGRCIYWDGEGRRQEVNLGNDASEFVLAPNSIAFVQVEPMFRLPDYMALRFNLKITMVHRGILLGTGPLVDPGFVGRLLIPVHNLTTNDYIIQAGEGLIWIEFTKTSPVRSLGAADIWPQFTYEGVYRPFPEGKHNLSPEHYLMRAAPHRAIRSSIPEIVKEGREAARTTNERLRELRAIGFISAIALAVTLAALAASTWSLIQDTWSVAKAAQHAVGQDAVRALTEARRVDQLEQQVTELRQRQEQLAAEVKGGTGITPKAPKEALGSQSR
jgi:deoxycytidine triphosphate deaminase